MHVMKYIFHYFKYASKSAKDDKKDVCLPNLHGPLSSKVPPEGIEIVNNKVAEIVLPPTSPPTPDSEPISSGRKH